MNLRGSLKRVEFLDSLSDYQLLSKDVAGWSKLSQFLSLFAINGRPDKKVPLQGLFFVLVRTTPYDTAHEVK